MISNSISANLSLCLAFSTQKNTALIKAPVFVTHSNGYFAIFLCIFFQSSPGDSFDLQHQHQHQIKTDSCQSEYYHFTAAHHRGGINLHMDYDVNGKTGVNSPPAVFDGFGF